MQESYDAFLFIADLHAITDTHDARELARTTLSTAAIYLACGVDPERSTLFVQSHVAAHSQLARYLGAVAPVGMLRRMIQFKEKAVRQGQDASLGLLDYPVLMSADILLYDAELVPVGDDQQQHLQLARDLAERFNRLYGTPEQPVFRIPKPLKAQACARLMSLTDGSKKMSKSEPNDFSRINLLDPPDVIRAKIKRAKTDSTRGLEFDNPARPEAHNLLSLYLTLSGKERETVAAECADMGYGDFKRLLADATIATLEPIQKRYSELMSDRQQLLALLKEGSAKANAVADGTLSRAAEAIGFLAR